MSACDNSSYSENIDSGSSDSTNEDVNTPSDETPTDDPNGENENPGSEENNDENQDDIEAQSVNFSVRVQAYLTTGEILSYSTLNSRGIYAGRFSIYWYEGDGKSGHGDAKTWGNTPTKTAAYGYSIGAGNSNSTYASGLAYFSYSYGMGVQRYARLYSYTSSRFTRWSVSTSSSFESSRQSTGTTSTTYLYGRGITSTSKPTSSVGTTMSGTWYVKYRQNITISYNANGGSGAPSSTTAYAGVDATLSSSTPTRSGYIFNGWEIDGCIYSPGSKVMAESLENAVGTGTSCTAYAQWIPNESWTTSGNYATSFADGNGTQEDPYRISNERELARVAYLVNSSSYNSSYASDYYLQTTNLDMSDFYWVPIGTSSYSFKGHYDGAGYTVSGLYTKYNEDYQGLFGYIEGTSSNRVEIKNIGITSSQVFGSDYVGGVVGYGEYVDIENCYNSGNVLNTNNFVGGIVGEASYYSATTNCYNMGLISGDFSVGGIIGYNTRYSNIYYCYNVGNIIGRSRIGGICGGVSGSFGGAIENCFNVGNVFGYSDDYIGGVLGYSGGSGTSSEVVRCYYGGSCTLSYGVGSINGSGSNTGTTRISRLNSTSYAKNNSWYTNSSNWTGGAWDFTYTWTRSSSVNDGYPTFRKITVTYYSNFGNNTTYSQQYVGSSVSILSYMLSSRTGYTFSHWSTNSSGTGTTYTVGTTYNRSSNLSLYAIWDPNEYTNRYRYRNISGIVITYSDQTRTYGQSFTTLSTSNIPEYVSNGWSLYGWADSSGDTDRDFATNASVSSYNSTTGIVYLYAISSRTITINYNANGGSNAPSATTEAQRWNQYGEVYNISGLSVTSSEPTRTGYTFLGWSTSSTATTPTYEAGDAISFTYSSSNSRTLYAVWEVNQYQFDSSVWVDGTKYSSSNSYITFDVLVDGTRVSTGISDFYKMVNYGSIVEFTNFKVATGYTYSSYYTTPTSIETSDSTKNDIKINMQAKTTYLNIVLTANVYTITLNKQSGSGGTSTIYLKYNTGWYSNSGATTSISTVVLPTRAGFTFQGYYTGTNGSGTQVINSSGQIISGRTTITTSNISLHANWTAKNPARYDSEKGYWYVEMGYYPQTRATETEINGITNTNGAVYTIKGTNVTSKIGANSIEYCQYNGVWYKVEPVRYVLSGNYSSGYGTESGNYLAVTEKVVFASAWSSTKLSLGDGYTSSTLRTNISDFISDTQMNIDYTGARSYTIKNFRNVNGASADTTLSVDIIASNESEIESVFGDLSAEFSDLVSDILGNNLMYWTRDVGSNLNTAECITRLGSSTQTIMQKILGVRLTANVSIFGCV